MANGLCPYVLQDLSRIAGAATPQYKVDMHGLIEMLHTAGDPNAIKVGGEPTGHKKEVRISFRQRYTKAQTDTSLSCDQVLTPSRIEDTVSVGNVRQIAVHIPDELVATYCEDASRRVLIPNAMPSSTVAAEVLDNIMSAANALLQAANDDLWALTVFGKNRAATSNSMQPQTVNFPKDASVQPVTDGITKILADYGKNNLSGRPQVVGMGIGYNAWLQQGFKMPDFAGVNSKIAFAGTDFYPDQDIDAIKGANSLAVFEPGSIQFVQYKRYTGFKAGVKPGGSEFGMLPLPMYVNGVVKPVWFDYQYKYYDCPTTLTDAYSGQSVNVDKGYSIILSLTFGLYQISPNAYNGGDANRAVTGALLYTASNNCDTCN